MKALLKIYKQGWVLIAKALLLAVIIWVLLLPFNILQWAEQIMPAWMLPILGLFMLMVYLPFAAYWALRGLNDLNRTDHQIIPLLDRIRGKR